MSFVYSKGMLSGKRGLGTAGVTSLELAVTFGFFALLLCGMIDMSRYFFSQHALTALVNAAARQGAADPGFPTGTSDADPASGCSGPALPADKIPSIAPLLDPAKVALRVCGSFFPWGIQIVKVTATYDFETITPGLESLMGPMTASVTYQY